ncbi:MAG: hypothetical protein GX922_02730 [Firmicutes bacterium]|nr:hypothetical protein [Bacillota bacterium]
MTTLCIAIHNKMLAAALAVPAVERPLSQRETMQICAQRYQDGTSPYPTWYLFGCQKKNVTGLVTNYTRQGLEVFLCPEKSLKADIRADYIDVQFCSTVDTELVSYWQQAGKKVFGYLPTFFSSKAFLGDALKKNNGARYLPLQKNYNHKSNPILPGGNIAVWILKTPYGSAGKNSDGTPYTVWQSEALEEHLPSLIKKLKHNEELICSEFIFTNDPYAYYADHVVHKMHFLSTTEQAAQPYGLYCQKFIHHCNWPALQAQKMLPLGEFIGKPEITNGYIDNIHEFTTFVEALSFHKGRVMLSIDFILPPDGIPRYLETNKLAATFAEQFDPHLPPLVDYYAQLPLNQ